MMMDDSIGRILRQAREAADLSLDDVVFLGKIPRGVAEALESDNFSFFSSPFYAKSFLEKYSSYLGVDAGDWLDALEPATLIDREAIDTLVEFTRHSSIPIVERTKTRSSGGMASASILVISGFLIFGGIRFYQSLEQQHTEKPAQVPSESVQADSPAEEAEEEETPAAVTDTSPPRAIIVE